MKRYIVIFAAIGLLLYAGQAGAVPKTFTQNEFTTAESIDPGMTQTGIHFTLGDDYKSFYPAFRYGTGALFEVGVKFGVTTADFGTEDKIGGLVGADLNRQDDRTREWPPITFGKERARHFWHFMVSTSANGKHVAVKRKFHHAGRKKISCIGHGLML